MRLLRTAGWLMSNRWRTRVTRWARSGAGEGWDIKDIRFNWPSGIGPLDLMGMLTPSRAWLDLQRRCRYKRQLTSCAAPPRASP